MPVTKENYSNNIKSMKVLILKSSAKISSLAANHLKPVGRVRPGRGTDVTGGKYISNRRLHRAVYFNTSIARQ